MFVVSKLMKYERKKIVEMSISNWYSKMALECLFRNKEKMQRLDKCMQ